jgi:hypothetical protein
MMRVGLNWAEIGSVGRAVVVLGFIMVVPHMSRIGSFT